MIVAGGGGALWRSWVGRFDALRQGSTRALACRGVRPRSPPAGKILCAVEPKRCHTIASRFPAGASETTREGACAPPALRTSETTQFVAE